MSHFRWASPPSSHTMPDSKTIAWFSQTLSSSSRKMIYIPVKNFSLTSSDKETSRAQMATLSASAVRRLVLVSRTNVFFKVWFFNFLNLHSLSTLCHCLMIWTAHCLANEFIMVIHLSLFKGITLLFKCTTFKCVFPEATSLISKCCWTSDKPLFQFLLY